MQQNTFLIFSHIYCIIFLLLIIDWVMSTAQKIAEIELEM